MVKHKKRYVRVPMPRGASTLCWRIF